MVMPSLVLLIHLLIFIYTLYGNTTNGTIINYNKRRYIMSFRGNGLPGDKTTLPTDSTYNCEYCMMEDLEAVKALYKVQGETDSFGCEWLYLCEKHTKGITGETALVCDSCNRDDVSTYPTRDPNEGGSGTVYYYCKPCMEEFEDMLKQDE